MSEEKARINSWEWHDAEHEQLPKLENLYGVVATGGNGLETICATWDGLLVGDRTPDLARMAATLATLSGKSLRLVRFVRAEVVEVFEP